MIMSKSIAVSALIVLALATSMPAAANYSGSGSAASFNRAGTDKQDYFKLNRLRGDGSSLVLSSLDERVVLGQIGQT